MARFHKKTDESGLEFNAVQHILIPATNIMKKELLLPFTVTTYYIYDNGEQLGKPFGLDDELREYMITLGYGLKPYVQTKTKGVKNLCGYPVTISQNVKGHIHIKLTGSDAIESREKFLSITKHLRKCDPSIKGKCHCTESTKPNIDCKSGKVI